MANMIDNDKMWASLIEGNSVRHNNGVYEYGDLATRIRIALKEQGLEFKEGSIKPIESKPEFKEGDILYNKDSYASDSIFIFKGMSDKTNVHLCYARLYDEKDFSVYSKEDWDKGVGICGGEFYPANHKQKELLFSKMEKEGYKWYPGTRTLEKIEKPTLSSIFKGEWYICIKPVNYFTVGKIYYAIMDWVLRGDLGYTVDVRWTPDCFCPATKEDIEKQTTRLNPSTIEMLEKPSTIKFDEPDFKRMEAEYCTTLDIPHGELDGMIQSKMCSAYRHGLEDMWNKLVYKEV